ncbi:MAG: glycerol dehydratase reactivase beta/small subunit family protein [Eubacteriaceae bacterium]|nr:glycerol dehydratase reactivase beta/small subunit family protein [Eubacteriaceae bacterium]
MNASFDAPKPEINVFYAKNSVPKDIVTEVTLGIEEEGIPFVVLEKENKNARELAYKAAEASHIGVGIGISDEVVLHYIKLKGDTPLFAISSQSNEENLRAIGSNAGRLMKRMPFRDVE